MSCHRCHGLMVPDHPFEYGNDADALLHDFTPSGDCPLRCVCCGNIIDAVILANRAAQFHAQLRTFQDQLWAEKVGA